MFKIIYSNRMTELATRLAELQSTEPLPPLEAETVIVQSNELARWLSLFLAHYHGINSHVDFPYPSAFIWNLFRKVLPDVPKTSPFSKDAMTWRLFNLLPVCRKKPGFEEIDFYLGSDDDPLKCYGLACKIADHFDQYLMYRPDWIRKWEQGESPHWQAMLWQRLVAGKTMPLHRANLLFQLRDYLLNHQAQSISLPTRVIVFGLSSLPPIYLELLQLMARDCDVYIFFLSPSKEYWGDLIDPKKRSKKLVDAPDYAPYLTAGHPLLASMGKQGQAFFEQLADCDAKEESIFIAPLRGRLLGYLQHDIFILNEASHLPSKTQIADQDDSISVHVCHSAMREIEVLHDQLLALFERYPTLSPTDVVVMTPHIDQYAAQIDAVFGCANPHHFIPYGVATGKVKQSTELFTAFNSLLALPQSRFAATSIVGLLECTALQKRFSLTSEHFALIERWVQETNIKWGLSAEDKAELDLPATQANTWRSGLDRLLLGYALPLNDDIEQQRLFEDQLAFDGMSDERAEIVAQLCAFIDRLDNYRQRLRARLDAKQWQILLLAMLDDFFTITVHNQHDESALFCIRHAINHLVEVAALAGFEQAISVDLVKRWLQDQWAVMQHQSASRFMGYGVTFCGMVPMRSVPFKVVCLIGMNDDNYPRRQPSSSFDLLAKDIRKGDRSNREDDRYLFLESLLSAQSHFYISYVGASIQDNSPIPPSVLVSDLKDVLQQGFETEQGGDIWQACLTLHPLQPFSERYFNGISYKLFSYDTTQCPPADKKDIVLSWLDEPLPEADTSWRQVSINALTDFFYHPAKYLCQKRLGLYLKIDDKPLDSREPFSLDSLQAWQVRQQLLAPYLNGQPVTDILPIIKKTGVLPQGNVGDYVINHELEKVKDFAKKWRAVCPDEYLPSVPFDELAIGDFILYGDLTDLASQGFFSYKMNKINGGTLLNIWLRHLILNCIKPKGVNLTSFCMTKDANYHFEPVDNAKSILRAMLDFYWQGLGKPLSLFSKTSFAYAKAEFNDESKSPINTWLGNENIAGEKDDIYYQQIYLAPPLDDEFKNVALAVYQPLMAHLKGKL